MAGVRTLVLCVLFIASLQQGLVIANFWTDMTCIWGPQNYYSWNDGENIALSLTKETGSSVASYSSYLFGSITLSIKLVGGNSAGTVTTFYIHSGGEGDDQTTDTHDEVDFEFLGNETGQPYTIHTNIYVNGVGNKEIQFKPWFDPTDGFHNYTIFWNNNFVGWFVDGIPVRMFKNYESKGLTFPNSKAMMVYSSIWDAEAWATQGGTIKTDWSVAPFTATYANLELNACPIYDDSSYTGCWSNSYWWNTIYDLDSSQQGQMEWVQGDYMITNYCTQYTRFNNKMPPECSYSEN